MVQKASYKYLQRVNRKEGAHPAWSSAGYWTQARPPSGIQGHSVIWKREHCQSLYGMVSVILIFISIQGVLWQGIVKFNLV